MHLAAAAIRFLATAGRAMRPQAIARGLSYRATARAPLIVNTFLISLAAASPSLGQPASQPSYDPRQFERRLDEQPLQSAPASTRPPIPKMSRPADVKADTTPLFVLRHVSITGATAISRDQLVSSYEPYVGKKVSQADLTAIATGISERYRAAGFHLSRAIIPPQDIKNGRVRLQVIEGSITAVALKGAEADEFGVRPMLGPVLVERPSRLQTLERQLLLINGRPGVRIEDTMLEEIGNASGRFRLVVLLKTWHVFTSFGFDNLGSSAVGPWQSYAAAGFNSLLTPGDTLGVNLSTTPADPRELAFGKLSYDVPIGTDGLRVGASGLYSEVRPGDLRRLYNDYTTMAALDLHASVVPWQQQRTTLTLTAATSLSNVSESDVFGPVYRDRIRTASLTADYWLQDTFAGNNYLTVTMRHGLDALGASHSDDLLSRNGASNEFSALTYWFTRYQKFDDVWSLKLAAAGQMASQPLFLSEQFYLGGLAFGRGYSTAEVSGDNGLAGSIELRFDQKLNLQYVTGYQIYGFGETGGRLE